MASREFPRGPTFRIGNQRLHRPCRRKRRPSPQFLVLVRPSQKQRDSALLHLRQARRLHPLPDMRGIADAPAHAHKYPGNEHDEVMHRGSVGHAADLVALDDLQPAAGFDERCEVLHGGQVRKGAAGTEDEALVDEVEGPLPGGGPGLCYGLGGEGDVGGLWQRGKLGWGDVGADEHDIMVLWKRCGQIDEPMGCTID